MAIVRVIKDKSNPYVMLNKTCLNDDRVSWKAKGLHTYLLSLPDDWQIYVKDLKNRSKDGRDSTATAMNELIELGYVKRNPRKDDGSGKFTGGFDYEVYEIPISLSENRNTENPESGKTGSRKNRQSENPKLLNNKYKLNNKYNKLIIGYYQKHIGVITPNLSLKLLSFLDDGMEADVIISAIDETVGAGIRNFNYLLKILNNWLEEGIKEGAQLTEHQNKYKNKKTINNSINENKEKNKSFGGNSDGKSSTYNDNNRGMGSSTEVEVDVKELAEQYGIDIEEI